ncbi:MAG: hypothetical protein R6X20_08215 [Phycisphaerae bacterium]
MMDHDPRCSCTEAVRQGHEPPGRIRLDGLGPLDVFLLRLEVVRRVGVVFGGPEVLVRQVEDLARGAVEQGVRFVALHLHAFQDGGQLDAGHAWPP